MRSQTKGDLQRSWVRGFSRKGFLKKYKESVYEQTHGDLKTHVKSEGQKWASLFVLEYNMMLMNFKIHILDTPLHDRKCMCVECHQASI